MDQISAAMAQDAEQTSSERVFNTEVASPPPLVRQPSLLPAFEPFSSSPALPRPSKRKFDDTIDDRKYYPTPVPTSSTGVLPSSPPARRTRPPLQRSVSTLSERAPLGDVPTLDLPINGEPILMGRSSNSSDYQLPGNRQISRIHVRAQYFPPHEEYPGGKVEVECLGWNGAKVHCRGEIVELAKGEVFTSDRPMMQILVDVQDTRVILVWPGASTREPPSRSSGSLWVETSPSKRRAISAPYLASSPPLMAAFHPASPSSPSPNVNLGATFNSTFRVDDNAPIQVYEDHDSDEDAPHDPVETPKSASQQSVNIVASAIPLAVDESRATASSEIEEFSEHDEENDPIVHSFYGENLMSRFESFASRSPIAKRKPLETTRNSPGRPLSSMPAAKLSPIKNHVINQLAFSRIHSLPLSTIHSQLPLELRGSMAKPSDTENCKVLLTSELKTILDDIPCVGEISREGKDAAGKLLESEFYYVPELDTNTQRRDTVTQSLGKTGLRAARKQHKQYYWKRPRH